MNAKVINDTTIRTGTVRLSYPNLFSMVDKTDDNGNVTGQHYTVALIIPKAEKDTVDALKAAMVAAAKAKWGDKIPAGAYKTLRDGDTDPNGAQAGKEELKGCYWINCTSNRKVAVIGRTKDEFTGQFSQLTQDQIKAGDWVRAQVNCYAFEKKVNKGVAFGFAGIQFWEEGEALASGGFVQEAFEDDDADSAFN